jgi:hypothetical protein
MTLYRYLRADNGITVSPIKPENCEYTTLLRLVADEGKLLTRDNENYFDVIDVSTTDGWTEVDELELAT